MDPTDQKKTSCRRKEKSKLDIYALRSCTVGIEIEYFMPFEVVQ